MKLDVIRALRIEPIVQEYGIRETVLYALGLGYGGDPTDTQELPFVYEGALKSVPSYVNVLCHPGFWAQRPEFGIDWVKILHAEQDFRMHAPLPPTGALRGEYSVRAIEDKGDGRGALMHQDKELYDVATGTHIATVRSTLFLRGDGGQGGFGEPPAPATALPDRAPDCSVAIATLPRQALIYRLSGDWNPLHADPAIAAKAGFPAPILHGLCTNGIACRAALSAYCDNDPARLTGMFTRFSKPVMPGETIRVDFFEEGDAIRFRAVAQERNETVLDRCSLTIA
ncbi:MaoC family dehydratase [Novosphingobium sp. 9U]|uniref:MaoC family dehydratase n=1 Tax=Novosphingobium sp. 9U TaxID=2653158 RepID=UPI0012EEF2CB|nr:MaoC family dehydratase [Novosphingobium sp. 9U]VWX50183.1 3-alpha,7-alpha, 12-alpha-trihydroxy-5-beta-cholest-24-enoyl-CoA hydratase [Novosphingobium sp. 9U]